MGDAERAVRKMESSFRMRNVGFSLFSTCILPRFMRTVILLDRWKISDYLQSKRVSHAVKMVDSCSIENGVLCTVTRSWLLFRHVESEGKFFNQMLLEVLMNCTKHFDLSSSSTASYIERFMICWVCRFYFSGLVCSVPFLDECLIKINYGWFVYVFFYARKNWSCGVVCVWPRTNSDTIVSMFIWFCYLEWDLRR